MILTMRSESEAHTDFTNVNIQVCNFFLNFNNPYEILVLQ